MGTVTIVIPISRPHFLKELFASLEALTYDRDKITLFCYVDGDHALLEKVKSYLVRTAYKKEYHMRGRGVGSTGSVHRRRQRIADIHNEMKEKIPASEYVFLVEDDTIVPPDSLETLIANLETFPEASFASGIELGRWGFPIIGVWLKYPDVIESARLEFGIHSASAAGFYCMVTYAKVYKGHHFAPFEKILGPDVNFGFTEGMGVVNYDIKCKHLQLGSLPLTFDKVEYIRLRFTKNEAASFGWDQEVI